MLELNALIEETKRYNCRANTGGNNVHIERKYEKCDGVYVKLECTQCKILHPVTSFLKSKYGFGYRSVCKSCRVALHKKSYQQCSMAQFLQHLVNDMKTRTKRKRFDDTIQMEDMLQLIIAQGGRCYYSEIPMCYIPNQSWKCSPERLDNTRGYEKDNVVLVCNEFNTSRQWSRAKFELFMKSCRDNHKF